MILLVTLFMLLANLIQFFGYPFVFHRQQFIQVQIVVVLIVIVDILVDCPLDLFVLLC